MISYEYLKKILRYDPESGKMFWTKNAKKRRLQEAGYLRSDGRYEIGINGRAYLRSRLAYFYMTGSWPKYDVDHEDRNPTNDKWKNLRDLPHIKNCWNRGNVKRKNSHLPTGVTLGSTGRFQAQFNSKYLGMFDTVEEAKDKYDSYVKENCRI